MSVKTAGVGHFQIPTAPAAGTSVTSGAANTYTTNAVQLIASTAAALYITGIYAEEAAVSSATYKSVQLMIGGAGAETVLGQYLIDPKTGSTVTRTYRPIFPPIPVASGQRISVKTADSAGALATLISLECIAQSNVVDDGVAMSANVTQYGGSAGTFAGGRPEVNATHWRGTALAAPTTAGIPRVAIEAAADFAQAAADKVWSTAARLLTAGTNIVLAKGTGVTGFNDIAATDVWAAATRTLTAGTNIVLAKGVGLTGLNDLDAAGVRTAVGLAAANLDTQLAAIASYIDTEVASILSTVGAVKLKTDNLPASPAATGDAMTLTAGERTSVADALLNRNVAGGSSAGRLVKESLAFLRNKWTLVDTTLTVYDTDDVTVLWTAQVARTAGDPVSSSDPA